MLPPAAWTSWALTWFLILIFLMMLKITFTALAAPAAQGKPAKRLAWWATAMWTHFNASKSILVIKSKPCGWTTPILFQNFRSFPQMNLAATMDLPAKAALVVVKSDRAVVVVADLVAKAAVVAAVEIARVEMKIVLRA